MTVEPDLREQLLADYDAHEKAIEKAANVELWALGDWLAQYVPPREPGPQGDKYAGVPISLEDLAAQGHRSVKRLQRLRRLALVTEADRLPQVTPTAYEEALQVTGWDLMKANARILERGHRKRDQREGPHESVDAIQKELGKRSPEDRARVARELAEDPTVRDLLGDEPVPDFGAAWVDKLIIRVEENADKLTSHIKHEGLVFSPNADLPWFLEALQRAELQIAEVRAAVQERLRDEQIREGVR